MEDTFGTKTKISRRCATLSCKRSNFGGSNSGGINTKKVQIASNSIVHKKHDKVYPFVHSKL